MSTKIAIVNSSSFGRYFPEHMERLKRLGEVDRIDVPKDMGGKKLAQKLMGYSIIIASVTALYNKEFFIYKDETVLITRHGIGYNNIDVKAATEKKTFVTKVDPLVEREAVAENAVSLLMSVLRQVGPAFQKVREGEWRQRAKFMGYEVKNKIVGIIGFGNIGSRVGEILKNGFDAKIIAYDPYRLPREIKKQGVEPVPLEELLKKADILSLNAFVDEKSYHLLSKKEFSMMKKGVYIVNTARGELMDQNALLWALDEGIVAGLGVDVIEGEPIDKDHPLLSYPNVLITPHTSAYTYECLKGMGEKVVSDVEKVLKGENPDGVINRELLK
ncbi:D-isomer specific 2-hydroxyacid dehydrogenase family protein [Garciella nitratireducens]|uniref:D-isomer specific 2-hydroxyacid dehydrogenase family protein n=1 Tax=Garciella nitratireducens TaxID=218205 RepID=UPI001BD1F03F|nr:D-isomer specific 2-hydroxyacid dehydrogenase family protein [Garciella nitratireducens]